MARPLLGVLLLSSAAFAQDPSPSPKPDETRVVVTASPLNPKDVFDTPYSADVIVAQDGERRLSKTTPDLFKELPGVNVQKTAYGHGSPYVRGFTGFRNVFLVDGVRLNSSAFRDGPNQYWNTVDSYLVDRMEIVRGPSSVLYGSDSLGGTILVDTPDIELPREGTDTGSRSRFRWASAEDSYTAREEVWVAVPGFGVRAGGTYRDLHDLSGGRKTGLQPGTGYDEYDADFKAVMDAGAQWRITAMAQHTRQNDVPRTHSTVDAKTFQDTTPGSDLSRVFDQGRDLFYLQAEREEKGFRIHAGLSYHMNLEDSRRETGSTIEKRSFVVNTPGVFGRAGIETSAGFLTFGGEIYHDQVNSAGHNTDKATGTVTSFTRGEIADDSTVDAAGLFVQDEITFGALDVTAGLRYSWQRIEAGEVDPAGAGVTPGLIPEFEESYDAVVGSLRLLYHLDSDWNLIGGLSQGFRAPSLDDTTSTRLRLSGQTDFPNPDLDPERSLNAEIGLRTRQGPVEAGGFLFHSWLNDFIVTVPAPAIGPTAVTKENGDAGWMYGGECFARWEIAEAWSLSADVAYVFGKVDQAEYGGVEEEPLGKLPPASGHLGVRYQPPRETYWAELVLTAARHQQRLSPADELDTQRIPPGGTPGFTVATIRGGVELCPTTRVTAAVENVTDKDYRYHGSGTNEPGTSFVVGIDVRL